MPSLYSRRRRARYERKPYPKAGRMFNPYWGTRDPELRAVFGSAHEIASALVTKAHAAYMNLWDKRERTLRAAGGEPHWADDPTYDLRRKK
jgi:hypothetical protein